MIGCNLTVGIRVKSDGTQLKMELGEDNKPEVEEEVEQRRCKSTPSGPGQGLQGKVTLAEEDDKPEDGGRD